MKSSFLADVRTTLIPDPDGRHGPLPPILVSMTVVTGLVDAVSYLTLGHVFVANMTGNIVFLGFALAGAPGFSIAASLTAIAAFLAGALAGGRLSVRYQNTGVVCTAWPRHSSRHSWRRRSSWPRPGAARHQPGSAMRSSASSGSRWASRTRRPARSPSRT